MPSLVTFEHTVPLIPPQQLFPLQPFPLHSTLGCRFVNMAPSDDEKDQLQAELKDEDVELTQQPTTGGDQRIQFDPAVKPSRPEKDRQGSYFVPPGRRSQSVSSVTRRPQSIVSIPPVVVEKEKKRRKKQDEQQKHVDISEHLLPHEQVAERYHTHVNMQKPGESLGLTSDQAAKLLLEHGPNILQVKHPAVYVAMHQTLTAPQNST